MGATISASNSWMRTRELIVIPNGWVKSSREIKYRNRIEKSNRETKEMSEERSCLPVPFTSTLAPNVAIAVLFTPAVATGAAGVVVDELDLVTTIWLWGKWPCYGTREKDLHFWWSSKVTGCPLKWNSNLQIIKYSNHRIINHDRRFEPLRIETPWLSGVSFLCSLSNLLIALDHD